MNKQLKLLKIQKKTNLTLHRAKKNLQLQQQQQQHLISATRLYFQAHFILFFLENRCFNDESE